MRPLLLAGLGLCLVAAPAFAQDSAANGSAAGSAASELAAHLTASGVQTAVGVAAVPASGVALVSAGAGGAMTSTGVEVSKGAAASADLASGPLKVDDKVVVSPDPMPQVPYAAQKPK